MRKLKGWAVSSASPEEVSTRIKGVVTALSSIIIFVATKLFDVNLTPDNVLELATHLSVLGGLIWSIYGAFLAFIRWIATIKE